MPITDEELVQRVQDGDRSAFDLLVERYKVRAFQIARGVVGNPEDAKDLTQEAFLRAFQGIGRFGGKSTFFTWYCRILVNLCIDHQRWRKRWFSWVLTPFREGEESQKPVEVEQVDERATANPGRVLENRELGRRIEESIAALPKQQRMVFLLRHYHDLPLREIAIILGMAEGTVKSHLFRSIQSLQQRLKDYGSGEENDLR